MKRAVDKNELKTVLKHAAVMLNELRTGLLLPKSYYDLFMRVCDELHVLDMYFADVVSNGKSVVELYQQVQHWSVQPHTCATRHHGSIVSVSRPSFYSPNFF